MRERFDHAGKEILRNALESGGTVVTQLAVPAPDAQAIDTWFEPAPGREAELRRIGLLGRMAHGPTMFEPFHDNPDLEETRACIRKQLTQDHGRCLEAKKQKLPRPPFPHLWSLSPGRPEAVLRSYDFTPAPDFPPGFYERREADAFGLLVLRELPRTRETLLLRLMGAGAVLKEALAELARLPTDAWERQVAIPPLIAARLQIPQDTIDPEDREIAMSLMDVYNEWKHEVEQHARQQGIEAGRAQGIELARQQALIELYEARFGAMPEEVRAAIEVTHDLRTLQQWTAIAGTRTRDEVDAVLRAEGGAS
jgi:hypothetical protein